MKMFAQYCLGFLALGLEVFTREAMNQSLWAPSFLLFFVLWMGTRPARPAALALLWVMSIFADGFSTSPVGSHMIPFGILYLLAIGLSRKLTINRAFGAAVFGALGGLIYLVVMATLTHFIFPEADMNKRLSALILPHLVIDALLVPILFPIFDRLTRVEQRNETMMSLGPRSP